jgi:hypothetical protein
VFHARPEHGHRSSAKAAPRHVEATQHYGKNGRCCATIHFRVLAHDKEFFAVRLNKKRTATTNARQRGHTAHGKQKAHGKAEEKRTAKKNDIAVRKPLPCAKQGRT